MKKIIILVTTYLVVSYSFGQVQNGDFENWTNTTHEDINPSGWKTSENLNLTTVSKSLDAQDQNYAVKLETQEDASGDTTIAFMVFGDFGDSGLPIGGFPYIEQPDSLIFWTKYDVQPGDSISALIVTKFMGGINSSDVIKWGGTQNNWERRAIEINATANTDSLIIAFAAGDGLNNAALPGTWLMIDNVTIKSNSGNETQIPNFSFENWEDMSYSNPDNWYSYNSRLPSDTLVFKSTLSHSAQFSAQLKTIEVGGDTVRSYLSNAPIVPSLNSFGLVPYSERPDQMELYYTFTSPNNIDNAGFSIEFFNNGTAIGGGQTSVLPSGTTAFTFLSIPITYNNSMFPDSMRILFFSGDELGSTLNVDLVSLTGGTVGISEIDFENSIQYFPNPTHNELTIFYEYEGSGTGILSVLDLNNKLISSEGIRFNPGQNLYRLNTERLSKGIYYFTISTNNEVITKKFVKQ